ncbi:MAG: response regulator [Lachnospiraceae bacterium]|nr:response regulator [Lachnospiraceae bacterium]
MQIEICDADQGFVLKNREGVVRVSFAMLEYVEVINKTVSFHLADGVIREVTAALTDFEEKLLERPEFFKIHRSYLVNLNYVEAIDTNCIVTKNKHNIPVSRLRRSQLQDAYMRFLHQTRTDASASDTQMTAAVEKLKRFDGLWRILLVDDEPAQRTFWADVLRAHGCIVRLAGNGEDALKLAADESCDCILLDVMLPDEEGFLVCEKLHKITSAPIIFLSCVTEADKQVEGFAAGGIDYITKDTSADLFWTKVETRIRLAMSERTAFSYGPLCLDLAQRRVSIDGKELLLTPVEFDILWRLSEHPEHIFTLEEIFHIIWSGQPWDGGQMVQMHMSRLRRKLEKAWEEHRFIETVWGQGYRFVPVND